MMNAVRLHLRRSSGVILVLVLLMIALCGAIVSQIASRVIRLSGQAADAQRESRHRWAAVSIRRTCLDLAPSLLTQTVEQQTTAVQQRSFSILLGGTRFEVNIQDESAKLPVQRVIRQFPLESVKPPLRALAGNRITLRSVFSRNPTSMKELIDQPRTNGTSASLRFWKEVSQRMTLWTDGRVNVVTADPSTLDALWRLEFKSSLPDEISAMRQRSIPANFNEALGTLDLTSSQIEFAREWFTTSSNTYSVWIDSQTESGDGFTAIYVRRRSAGFADEQFGFHLP
jgi:hypothetical protein